MNDLSTEIRIGADASGVEAGVGRAKRSLKDLGDSARSAGQTVAAAGKQAGESLATVGDGGEAAAKKIQRDTRSMQSSLQRYLATLEAGSKDSRKYWESMADFKGVDKNALRPLLDQLDAYKSKTVAASESTVTWSSNLTKIGAGVAGIAAVTASAGVAAKAMFDASASAERLRTMLDFSTGGNSAKEIEFLRGVTYRLGLEFTSTARAYGQFQAAAKGTALEGDKARGVFESVAKASAVMGLSAADTSGVLLALQQMISKGTVQAEELRGQLGERLPGAFQVAAKAMGVTTAELGKMLEQGQVVADDFLPKFGRALEENLGGAAEKAAQRLDAAVNRFDTAWEKLKQRAGDSGVSKAVAGELGAITRDLEAVTDGMDRAGRAGGGMWAQFGAAGAIAAGRVGFSTLNLAANSLNGAINALTGGVFGLRTDLALLPDVFKTDAQYAKALADRLAEAETKMAALQGTGASTTSNPYIRDSYYQLQEYIKELKKAQAEQAKLTGVPVVGVNEGIVAQGRAREAYNTQRAKDEEAAAAFRLNLAGVPASYVKEMQELIRLNQAGIIVGKEYTDALKKQQDELLKKTGAVKSSNAAANQEQNAYESLIASIRAKIEADNLEIAGGAALTESQRIRIKLDQDLAAGRVKLTAQNERAVRLALEELAASEASSLAAKTLAKANLDAAASREKYLTSLSTGLDKIKADTAAQLESTARMGLSKEAIAELDAAKLEMLATDLELQAIKAMDRNLDEQTYSALKQQAEAYRELAAAKKAGAAKEMELDLVKANQDAAKKAADEWQRAADDINRSLTDALLRGFESGKDFAENLRSTLKNMFSTLVLRPIISAALSPVAGAVNGFVGNAVGGAAGSGIGSGIATSIGTSAIGSAFSLGLTNFGTGLGSTLANGVFGGIGTNISNFGTLAGAGNLSGALGVAAPYLAGIGALYAIISSLDDSGTYHTGGAAQYSAATGLRTSLGFRDNEENLPSYNPKDNIDNQFGLGFGYVERGDQTIETVSNLARGLGMALDGVAVAFGEKAGYAVATAFADDTSEDGAWGALRISREGQDLLNWETNRQSRWAPREFGDGEEGYKQYLAAVAKDTRQVLLDMDLPSWADKMLESIGESASMEQLSATVQQIAAIKTQFVQLGKAMEMFDGISSGMESALLSAAGSIDALTASAAGYYDAVYTEQEKIARSREQLESTLAGYGQSLPATREQYRALVEQQIAAGESGAEFAVVLMGLAGTFAQVADDIDAQFADLAKSAADVFSPLLESIKQARADVAGTRADMLASAQVMTPAQIAAAVNAAMVYAPNTAGVMGAQGEVAAAASQVAISQSALDAARAAANTNQQSILAGLNKAVAPRTNAPGMTKDSLWEEIIGRNWQAHVARFGKGWNTRTTTDAERAAAINAMSREYSDAKNAEVYAAANWQSVQDAPSIAAAQSALAAAQAALAAAQQAEVQSKVDYAAQLSQFVTAAGGSVSKLSGLREEVVRFYEEQAAAVQSMIATAKNLRNVVGSIRMGQLDSAQTAAQLGSSYASDYSMALATTGTTRAGYADSMASTLPTLAEAIKAEAISASDWRVQTGKLLAQATGVAGMLEADAAGSDYQSVSLGLLGSIDTALAQLEGSTKSAEQVISQAIKDGTMAQLTGLRAVVAALRGDPIPAFATGGFHAGGLRLVGENGPELEATGPSRIWSAQQTAALFAGNGQGSNEALVSEIRALRSENQAQAAAMVNMQRELNKLMQRWDSQGMPEERIV